MRTRCFKKINLAVGCKMERCSQPTATVSLMQTTLCLYVQSNCLCNKRVLLERDIWGNERTFTQPHQSVQHRGSRVTSVTAQLSHQTVVHTRGDGLVCASTTLSVLHGSAQLIRILLCEGCLLLSSFNGSKLEAQKD